MIRLFSCISLFVFLLCSLDVYAGPTLVKGRVTDASTGQPLSYASVSIEGTDHGSSTNDNGYFELSTSAAKVKLKVTLIGYTTFTKVLQQGGQHTLKIVLQPEASTLNEVEVKSGDAPKYRNKNNPAVELIRQVIDHKDRNKIGRAHV